MDYRMSNQKNGEEFTNKHVESFTQNERDDLSAHAQIILEETKQTITANSTPL